MTICIKLYKQMDTGLHNVSVYNPEHEFLVVARGMVGEKCEQKIERVPLGASDKMVEERAAEFERLGYAPIDDDDLSTVVVQLQLEGWGSGDDLDRRNHLIELLDEHLAVTSNGHVDGGDIGSGTANVWCMVVDARIATRTITQFLKIRALLERTVIAIRNGDDFEVVYPADYEGEFVM